jgi:Protein of unknown function (DUF2442)
MHRIVNARANLDFSVDLRFEDGREAQVDLSELVRSAVVAAPFRDASRFVSDLVLLEDGEILHWDEQFELHADSLRYRAFPSELVADHGADASGRGRPAAE